MDAFLTQEIICNPHLFYEVPAVLGQLAFEPVSKNKFWQWGAHQDEAGRYVVMLDLLGAQPNDLSILEKPKDDRRIRPKVPEELKGCPLAHVRRTDEAAGIGCRPCLLDLGEERTLLIASNFNLIILKLGALYDRLDQPVLAQKHALDLLKIVSDMREDDWEAAQLQISLDGDQPYIKDAQERRRRLFGGLEDKGVLVLRDALKQEGLEVLWIGYLKKFIDDLVELSPAS
jgi:hypothetical protein